MKKFARKDKRSLAQKEDDRIVEILSTVDPKSEDYKTIASNRDLVNKSESYKKEDTTKINWNTVLVVSAGLLQFGLMVRHEEFNVITSKAISFIFKGGRV